MILLPLAGSSTRADEGVMYDGARGFLDLAGQWDVQPIDGLAFNFPPPAEGWKSEKVPSPASAALKEGSPYGDNLAEYLTSDKQALKHPTGNAAWFRRSFEMPETPSAERQALLYFGGIAFKSEVWLNGKKLGGSLLGQVPCSYDVTGLLRKGTNELVVGLTGRTGLIDVPNRTLLAPHWGVGAGIWGKVQVRILPLVSIGNVFINTRVKDKRIEFAVEVGNHGKSAKKLTLDTLIQDARQNIQTRIFSPEFTLAPGETKKVEFKKDWIAPELWGPMNAALYFAKVSLISDKTTIDNQTHRFGFREFEIRGTDFYLNGTKTILLRSSHLDSLATDRRDIFARFRASAGKDFNCVRLHGGFNSEALLDLCDEMGIMAIPEGAWHQADVEKFNLDKSELWLPTVESYYTKTIEQFYNHPSVIMWSLTNETYWGNTNPERMKISESLIATATKADSTRPVQGDAEVTWGGRLPIINIHYPESSVGNTLREKYPNSAFVFPNDYYWLKKNETNGSWRATFKWDRPLVVGEYWYPSGGADAKSAFMGESVYDWEKWRHQRMDGRMDDASQENEFVNSQKGLADAYRLQGAAGINPWACDGQSVMPALALRPVDLHANFFGGATGTRKFVVFNDSGRGYADMNLLCSLVADGQTLWETRIPAGVGTGETKTFEVKVECPAVTRQTKATLTVRLRCEIGGGYNQLDRYEGTVWLMPRPDLSDIKTAGMRLLDSTGATAKALASLGIKLDPLRSLTSAELNGVKVVVVGDNTDTAACKDALVEFATKGGSVLVLRQDAWTPWTSELPAIDKEHASTRSWLRTYNHPITAGLEDGQFSYWRPDHLVSITTFRKPTGGNFHALLDCGGLYGLNWTPLVEVPLGRGTVVLTTLDLIGRLGAEPAAGTLLGNMLRYAAVYQPVASAPLRVLAAPDARPLRASLKAAGVTMAEGVKGSGPILLDASFDPTPEQLAAIRDYLTKGGNVWLHGFSTATLGKVESLFPFKPVLKPRDMTVQSAIRRSTDPWINNISSQEFFWTKIDLEARDDYFGAAKSTAPLGGEVLQLPTLQSGVRLIEPALLVKVPVDKGALLFDTLTWEKALGSETDKVTRLISSLASNLGAEVHSNVDKTQYDYFPVDIQPVANMGYYDRVANDGKGGWTDDGDSDMRFFLINHVGKAGGVETGMETEAEPFPSQVTLAGRPFFLTDPRKTDNHSVISLCGGEHGAKLPSEAKGIKIGKKADKLWFLQATGWSPREPNQVVAKYVIHYDDGSETVFPVRFGIEVGDFWVPEPISGAVVAWTGRNLVHSPVGIFCAEWNNPFPNKNIVGMDVIGNIVPTQFVVVAICGGVVKNGGPHAETVSDWRLGEFTAGAVANHVPGGGALKATSLSPTLEPGKGLKFEGGQTLMGEVREIPGMGAMGSSPFAVRMTFTPMAKPTGYCGGLFQAMDYGKAGFRMVLSKDLRLDTEVFTAAGPQSISSKQVLDPGRTYTVELRFDGTYATLIIDGQTEIMKEMPLPAPCRSIIQIGTASGNGYNYIGTISDISILKLPATP